MRRSVINYGVPSFSGRSSRDFDRDELAREIRSVLDIFEPRLKDSATKVTVTLGDKNVGLKIEIDCGADHDADAGAAAPSNHDQPRQRCWPGPSLGRREDGSGLPGVLRGGTDPYPRAGGRVRRHASGGGAQPVARYSALPRPLCRTAARWRRLSRGPHPAQGRRRTFAVFPQRPRCALSRPRRAGAGDRDGRAEARPAGPVHDRRPCHQARHAAGVQPATRAVDALHLHHRPGGDALAGGDRFGQLFPGPQRAGGSRHHAGRRNGRRRSPAPHHQANRQRRAWRTGARPARPAFLRAHDSRLLFDAIFGSLRRLSAHGRKARPIR